MRQIERPIRHFLSRLAHDESGSTQVPFALRVLSDQVAGPPTAYLAVVEILLVIFW